MFEEAIFGQKMQNHAKIELFKSLISFLKIIILDKRVSGTHLSVLICILDTELIVQSSVSWIEILEIVI